MAFEIKFVFLEPRDVELLTGCTTLELAGDVFLVVFDNSGGRMLAMVST